MSLGIKAVVRTQHINVDRGVTSITVPASKKTTVTVNQPTVSVGVINAGPIGPTGVQGLSGINGINGVAGIILKPASNNFIDNCLNGTANTNVIGSANRIELTPMVVRFDIEVNQIGVPVGSGVVGTTVKVLIYSSDEFGRPNIPLYETAAVSTATSSTYASEDFSFTFLAGVIYWVGVRHTGTANLRHVNLSGAFNLGFGTSHNNNNYGTVLRRTVTFTDPPPSPWSLVTTDVIVNQPPPSIRFRVA